MNSNDNNGLVAVQVFGRILVGRITRDLGKRVDVLVDGVTYNVLRSNVKGWDAPKPKVVAK
jgi:hypothetical protein